MKKIIMIFVLTITTAFSLEIQSIDPLDFGEVVAGDRRVSLRGVKVYVEGEPNRSVKIEVPNRYELDGNEMMIAVKRREIKLDNGGRGKFELNVDLKLQNTREYETLTDRLYVKVSYSD